MLINNVYLFAFIRNRRMLKVNNYTFINKELQKTRGDQLNTTNHMTFFSIIVLTRFISPFHNAHSSNRTLVYK